MINSILKKVFIIAVTISCSNLDIVEVDSNQKKNESRLNVTCPIEKKPILVYSENNKLNSIYKNYFEQSTKQSFLDHYFKWSLLQLASRPDSTTLNSKTLTYIKYDKKEYFLITTPKTLNSSSYISQLNQVRKYFKKSRTIKSYARSLDNWDFSIPVSKELAKFLDKNKVSLYKNPKLRAIAFKGNQIAKDGETIRPPKFEALVTTSQRLDQNIFETNHLFKSSKDYLCNFDKNLFSSTPLIQRRSNEIRSNFFGLFQDKDNFFITLTSANPIVDQFNKNFLSLKSQKMTNFNAAICFSKNNQELIMAKNLIHSEQLLNNILSSTDKNMSPEQILNTKRFLNLLYPERTVVEIYGRPFLQKNDQTKYYIPTLGKVDLIKYSKGFHLYKEPRTGILKCGPAKTSKN